MEGELCRTGIWLHLEGGKDCNKLLLPAEALAEAMQMERKEHGLPLPLFPSPHTPHLPVSLSQRVWQKSQQVCS